MPSTTNEQTVSINEPQTDGPRELTEVTFANGTEHLQSIEIIKNAAFGVNIGANIEINTSGLNAMPLREMDSLLDMMEQNTGQTVKEIDSDSNGSRKFEIMGQPEEIIATLANKGLISSENVEIIQGAIGLDQIDINVIDANEIENSFGDEIATFEENVPLADLPNDFGNETLSAPQMNNKSPF